MSNRTDVVNPEAAYNACCRDLTALRREYAEVVREHNKLVILLAFLLGKHYPRREVSVSAMEWQTASAMGQAGIALSEGFNPLTGGLSFQVINVPAEDANH
jgi:hypothetical protein